MAIIGNGMTRYFIATTLFNNHVFQGNISLRSQNVQLCISCYIICDHFVKKGLIPFQNLVNHISTGFQAITFILHQTILLC